MNWQDSLTKVTMLDGRKLIGGTFRGVPFFVPSHERSGGRRLIDDEFPLRDDNSIQDLGRKSRGFSVDAYVLGADYVRQRDALLSALEDVSGPGELVHPYHGVKRVACDSFTLRESITEGGVATFSIAFKEAPDRPTSPVEQVDLASLMSAKAAAAKVVARAEFVDQFSILGLPAFAVASASASLSTASDALYTAAAPLIKTTQELAQLNSDVKLLTLQATSLIGTPGAMLDAFVGAVEALAETLIDVPGALVDALLAAAGISFGSDVIETTDTRTSEAANQDAINRALRRTLIIEAAKRSQQAVFASLEEATATRSKVLAALDEQLADAGYIAFTGLAELRAAVALSIPGDAVYARVINVERRVSIPSLLLAYQLYGAVDQEADLVARNHTTHPGFMAGTLQALSDG